VTTFTLVWIAIGIAVLPLTLVFIAPFGRHANRSFGPVINNRLGWIIMESPAILCFSAAFLIGVHAQAAAAWILWGLWTFHYVNRGLIFPLRIRTAGKTIPVLIVVFAFVFQLVNGFLNGVSLGEYGQKYTMAWLGQPCFIIGLVVFVVGWGVTTTSDEILLKLRGPGETGYKIPHGGLFRWVSCPNFLGEIIQWTGWAIMCWNLAALSFAVWTVANLVPRALAHHRWYLRKFADYPRHRKALIPCVW